VRFIDEDSVLVNDYSKTDPGFGERLFKVLRRNKLAIETVPYDPKKRSRAGIPSAVGCFTNFLRTQKVLVAPVYGTKHDLIALRKLRAVFAGLPIVPLACKELAREGGVLNCASASYRISQKTLDLHKPRVTSVQRVPKSNAAGPGHTQLGKNLSGDDHGSASGGT
jgi:agmatine deiminase